MFNVQAKQCESCIYKKDCELDVVKLEAEIADPYGGFRTFRQCHHTDDKNPACCAGFWARHKNEFQLGQISQRLGMVNYVNIDTLKLKADK